MTPATDTIDSLKKVALEIQAGTDADVMDLTDDPIRIEFIVGIGKLGISPFEYRLCGLGVGDRARIQLKVKSRHRFFEHLQVPLPDLPNDLETVHLEAHVTAVLTPTNQEVVKALARGAGCDGDCCGHHAPF